MVTSSPIFVADTKVSFGYDFVAPLMMKVNISMKITLHCKNLKKNGSAIFWATNFWHWENSLNYDMVGTFPFSKWKSLSLLFFSKKSFKLLRIDFS